MPCGEGFWRYWKNHLVLCAAVSNLVGVYVHRPLVRRSGVVAVWCGEKASIRGASDLQHSIYASAINAISIYHAQDYTLEESTRTRLVSHRT